MKFSVLTSNLSDGLKTASRAVNNKAGLPVLGNVHLEAKLADGEQYLAIAGTDMEIGLRTRVDAKVAEPGAVTLPARLLSNLISTWHQDAVVEAELHEKSQTLRMTCAGSKANVKGISADEFPLIANPSEWANVGLDPYDLRQALDRVVFAAAADESRPILTGVYVHVKDGDLHFAAADGFRMSALTMEADVEGVQELERGVIIPSAGLRELSRLVPGAGQTVRMCLKPGQLAQVAFVLYDEDGDAETILVSQLIEGNFPDYRQIIPKTTTLTVTADTHHLTTAISGAQVFASYDVNIVKLRFKPGTDHRPGQLVVTGSSAEMGEQEAVIDASLEGRMSNLGNDDEANGYAGAIAVNGKYALEALGAIRESQVEIRLTTPSSPLVLSPVGDDKYQHVIMPMHLS